MGMSKSPIINFYLPHMYLICNYIKPNLVIIFNPRTRSYSTLNKELLSHFVLALTTIFILCSLKRYTSFFEGSIKFLLQLFIYLLLLVVDKSHQPPLPPSPTGTLTTFFRTPTTIVVLPRRYLEFR